MQHVIILHWMPASLMTRLQPFYWLVTCCQILLNLLMHHQDKFSNSPFQPIRPPHSIHPVTNETSDSNSFHLDRQPPCSQHTLHLPCPRLSVPHLISWSVETDSENAQYAKITARFRCTHFGKKKKQSVDDIKNLSISPTVLSFTFSLRLP